ncbi:hypothetical protein [Emticicia sp. C21]|uniref:hypothetical protein n=1 Tax=Emticicia sp. C21 TaxID=2302915 RepID=UPI000E349DE7|nr:hypothetical protein [Emticicia sp. C21]RFS14369.1 hypothetical protein D0T08_21060 [Emticicia sp. C21]
MQNKLLILLLLVNLSCSKKEAIPTVYQIDPKLEPYLKSFVAEAQKRNITVKLENLIMKFDNESIEICGHFVKEKSGQREIVINPICWDSVPEQNREALAFHELGHCFLNRLHRNDLLPNNAPVSIMHIQNNGPYEPCIYPIDGDNTCNKTARRNYYIDELFNDKTPVPDWAK